MSVDTDLLTVCLEGGLGLTPVGDHSWFSGSSVWLGIPSTQDKVVSDHKGLVVTNSTTELMEGSGPWGPIESRNASWRK